MRLFATPVWVVRGSDLYDGSDSCLPYRSMFRNHTFYEHGIRTSLVEGYSIVRNGRHSIMRTCPERDGMRGARNLGASPEEYT